MLRKSGILLTILSFFFIPNVLGAECRHTNWLGNGIYHPEKCTDDYICTRSRQLSQIIEKNYGSHKSHILEQLTAFIKEREKRRLSCEAQKITQSHNPTKKSSQVISPLKHEFNKFTNSQRKLIQRNLQKLELYNSEIDGLFGEGTRSAILKFKSNYLETEEPDPNVTALDLLNSILAHSTSKNTKKLNNAKVNVLSEAVDKKTEFGQLSKQARLDIQKILKAMGYYQYTIDGLYGLGTNKAISRYQSEQNIKSFPLQSILREKIYFEAVQDSDDFPNYSTKMFFAAKDLIKRGDCSTEQIKSFGGWVKSTQRPGQYFIDCENNRFWLKLKSSSNSAKQDQHIPETLARDFCWTNIKRTAPDARIQAFNNSYTRHKAGSVTYTQGFKVKNSFGKTEKYYAYCTIESNREINVRVSKQ